MKKDDTQVTFTYKGKSVTTTASRLHTLAHSPRLLRKLVLKHRDKGGKK